MRDSLRDLVPPIGSVWSDEPFAPDRDFSQTVIRADDRNVTYESGSGDQITVTRIRFFDMFPWRCEEFEDLPGFVEVTCCMEALGRPRGDCKTCGARGF